jgi:dGTP triphosphohydrolase
MRLFERNFSGTGIGSSTPKLSGGSCIKLKYFSLRKETIFRTRLTHTLEVAQIARTIARSLRLNEDLTEAIAMGHDLGHTLLAITVKII